MFGYLYAGIGFYASAQINFRDIRSVNESYFKI